MSQEKQFMGKCMVCGEPAPMCCPLTFCDKCKKSKEADEVRKRHIDFIKRLVKERGGAAVGAGGEAEK